MRVKPGGAAGINNEGSYPREETTMDVHTQTHLKQLRDLLRFRLRELESDVLADELAARDRSDVHEVTDFKDGAEQEVRERVDSAQAQRDRAEMAQVLAAIDRLDHGRYGDCAGCGEAIALERLRVQPAALRCAPCQREYEQALHRQIAAPRP